MTIPRPITSIVWGPVRRYCSHAGSRHPATSAYAAHTFAVASARRGNRPYRHRYDPTCVDWRGDGGRAGYGCGGARVSASLPLGLDRDDRLAAIVALQRMPERFERAHPGAILGIEGVGVRLALPHDNRRVDAARLVGDEVEGGKAGRLLQLGKKALCARSIVSCSRAGLTVRRSTKVNMGDSCVTWTSTCVVLSDHGTVGPGYGNPDKQPHNHPSTG